MKIGIAGVGAVGGYFGACLADGGHEVVFLARDATLFAMRDKGLIIESPLGNRHIHKPTVNDHSKALGIVDLLLIAVKANQLEESLPKLVGMIGPRTQIVPLQNGVDSPKMLTAFFGDERVLGGLCKILSTRTSPACISHLGYTPTIVVGALDEETRANCNHVVDALRHAPGFTIEPVDDIVSAMWQKFLFVSAMSGVGAACESEVDVIRSISSTRAVLQGAMLEVAGLASALAVKLPERAVEIAMQTIDMLPPNATASMQRDISAGIASELEFQTGMILRLAEKLNFPTPINSTLYGILKSLEGKSVAKRR